MTLKEYPLGGGKARFTLPRVECFVGFWVLLSFGFEGLSSCVG